MITIAYVTGQLGLGGGEKQLYLVLKNLDRSNFKPVVISFNPDAGDFWEKPIRDLDIEIFFIPRSRFQIKRFLDFVQIIKSVHPKVIQSWSAYFNFPVSVVGFLLRIPIRVGAIRQNLFRQGLQPRSALDRYKAIIGLDYIITNSSRGMNHLIKLGVQREKIRLIFNGIESCQKASGRFERGEIRDLWGIGSDEIILGSVGTLHWVKNYQFMLEVFKALGKKHNNLWLVIFGDGPEKEILEKISAEFEISDRVKFLGEDNEASQKMQALDIFIFTSLSEGMPSALIEASLAGLPIVTSDIGGASDIVVYGKTGFVCDEYDIDLYCNYLSLLVGDLRMREEFGSAAHNMSVEKFNIFTLSQAFNDFYGKFLT